MIKEVHYGSWKKKENVKEVVVEFKERINAKVSKQQKI